MMMLIPLLGCVLQPTNSDSVSQEDEVSCVRAESITDSAGGPTGFVWCDEGGVDRLASWDGDLAPYEGSYGKPWVVDDSPECEEHGDCSPGERCVQNDLGSCVYTAPRCTSVCASDADCLSTEVCVPPEAHKGWAQWPTCVQASCHTGADCTSGECGLFWDDGNDALWLACRGEKDTCRSNEDCMDSFGGTCMLSSCTDNVAC